LFEMNDQKINPAGLRVILVGGPSNVGKSTLAQSLASRLGCAYASTDRLARYPGRPWGQVRPHVAEHYLALSIDQLVEDVIRHYVSLRPAIQNLVTAHATDAASDGLIVEGSAVWPESVADLCVDGVGALWLTASDGFLQRRIYAASGYDQASERERAIIDKFLGRVQGCNRRMLEAVRRLGLPCLDVEPTASLAELAERSLSAAKHASNPRAASTS
jgi:2-phosphoglycerate kinase